MLLDPGPYRLKNMTEQVHDGVLQRFVNPREPRDFVIRAVWSPAAAIYEKRTNRQGVLSFCIVLQEHHLHLAGK